MPKSEDQPLPSTLSRDVAVPIRFRSCNIEVHSRRSRSDASPYREAVANRPSGAVFATFSARRLIIWSALCLMLWGVMCRAPLDNHDSHLDFLLDSPWGFPWLFVVTLVLPLWSGALALAGFHALRSGWAGVYLDGPDIVFNTSIRLRLNASEISKISGSVGGGRHLHISAQDGRQWIIGARLFRETAGEIAEAAMAEIERRKRYNVGEQAV